MGNVKVEIIQRYGACSGLYTLRIGERVHSACIKLAAKHVTARPWELQRLLPSVRLALRTYSGDALENYLNSLLASFDQWRHKIRLNTQATPQPTE